MVSVVAKNVLASCSWLSARFGPPARVAIVGMMVSVLVALFAGRAGLIDDDVRQGCAERARWG